MNIKYSSRTHHRLGSVTSRAHASRFVLVVKICCKLIIWGSDENGWLLLCVISALCCSGSLSDTKSSIERACAHQLCLWNRYSFLTDRTITGPQGVVFRRVNHDLVGHFVGRNHQFRDPVLRIDVAATHKCHLCFASLHGVKVFVRFSEVVGIVRDTIDMGASFWLFHCIAIVDVCNIGSSTASKVARSHVNAEDSYPRTSNVVGCSLARGVIVGNALFKSPTNTHASRRNKLQVRQIEHHAGTVDLSRKQGFKIVHQGFFTPQFVRDIFYHQRIVMLWMNIACTTCQEIHPQLEVMPIFLLHNKEDESRKQVAKYSRDPHSGTATQDIGHTQVIPSLLPIVFTSGIRWN